MDPRRPRWHSAAMAMSLAVEALLAAAHRRGAAGTAGLARQLAEAGSAVSTPRGLLAWLHASGLPPSVREQLVACLPAAERSIGGYPLLAHLADGGMASIWLADGGGQLIAIKTLREDLDDREEIDRRFAAEVAATRSLANPHLVGCLASGSDDGRSWLALRFIPGGDLHQLVRQRGRLAEDESLRIVLHACRGLVAIHDAGLIHRDVKPRNILIDGERRVAVLADFGLIRPSLRVDGGMTTNCEALGTPSFMSPEQIRGRELDIRSDVYALGAVLYYCLAATPPFAGRGTEVLHRHLGERVPDVRALRPEVSERTAKTILRCLQKDPAQRHRNPRDLLRSLRETLDSLGADPEAPLSTATVLRSQPPAVPAPIATQPTDVGESVLVGPSIVELVPISHADIAETSPDETSLGSMLDLMDSGRQTLAPPAQSPEPAAPIIAQPPWSFVGAPDRASSAEVLVLSGTGSYTGVMAVLLARPTLAFGKTGGGVALPLRDYPAVQHADACRRVSRRHWQIAAAANGRRLIFEDLGSRNGTVIDGRLVKAGDAVALDPRSLHRIAVPGGPMVAVRAVHQRSQRLSSLDGFGAGSPEALCGLDAAMAFDGLVFERQRNRPELGYALVLRHITIGGDDADLRLPGIGRGSAVSVARFAGRWIGRAGNEAAWEPLCPGVELRSSGLRLVVRSYDDRLLA